MVTKSKNTYTAHSSFDGSLMFRVQTDSYTLRRGETIDFLATDAEFKSMSYPKKYLTINLKTEAKEEVQKTQEKVQEKVQEKTETTETKEVEKVEEKVEEPEKSPKRGRRKKTVNIETEEN